MNGSSKSSAKWLRFLVALIAAAILCAPLYWMCVTALQPAADLITAKINLVPAHVSLSGFTSLFKKNPVASWLKVSILITVGSSAISLVISTLAGYSLSRVGGRGHRVMGLALLLSRLLPGSLLVIPFYTIFLSTGLINNVVSVMLVNTVFIVPFTTWLLKGYFDSIPREIEDAAAMDGASRLRAIVSVVLPLSTPGIVAAASYSAVFAWGDFLFARTLLTSDTKWPVTVGIVSFIGDNGTDWNAIMAMGVVAIVPMAIIFVLSERFLSGGLTAGGMKG